MTESHLNPELRERLEQLATDCRHLIEAAKPRMRHLPNFADFPNGSCGDASLVLAWYLRQHDVTKPITYVNSVRVPSHAWLEVEGWLLDITAEQQSWGHPQVWILPALQSHFHRNYHPVDRRNAGLGQQTGRTKSDIRQAIRCLWLPG